MTVPGQRAEPRTALGSLEGLVRLSLAPTAAGDGSVEAARLVDFSRSGFRFRAPAGFEPGTRLACRVVLRTVRDQTLAFDAEVRWCLRLAPDDHEGGARIVGGAPEARLLVFERFLNYHRAGSRT